MLGWAPVRSPRYPRYSYRQQSHAQHLCQHNRAVKLSHRALIHKPNTSANTAVLPMSGTQYGNTVGETVKLTSRALEQAHFLHGT